MENIEVVAIKMVKVGEMQEFKSKIHSPKECANILINLIGNSDREICVVVTLSTQNSINSIKNITIASIGSLNSATLHPREVFKTAILSNGASIIIAHNHPSGNLQPSNKDINITQRIKEAGKILGIELLDHLIITMDSYISFKDKGLL